MPVHVRPGLSRLVLMGLAWSLWAPLARSDDDQPVVAPGTAQQNPAYLPPRAETVEPPSPSQVDAVDLTPTTCPDSSDSGVECGESPDSADFDAHHQGTCPICGHHLYAGVARSAAKQTAGGAWPRIGRLLQSLLDTQEIEPPQPPNPYADLKMVPGEAAEVLMEVRDHDDASALTGTVFDNDQAPDSRWEENLGTIPRSDREAFVQWIRSLEREGHEPADQPIRQTSRSRRNVVPGSAPQPSPTPRDEGREISRQLDEIANRLEDQGLYSTSDDLRAIAQQVREASRPTADPAEIEPDLADELDTHQDRVGTTSGADKLRRLLQQLVDERIVAQRPRASRVASETKRRETSPGTSRASRRQRAKASRSNGKS